MTKLVVGSILAIAFALAGVSSARGQGPDIQIVQLECSGDPELVVIENLGDAPQELAGWQLQSDPPDSEVFDLAALGGLQPRASVLIRSGPAATGVFMWGLEFVFRDDDPTDYARIVDDTGVVVHQVRCAGEVAPEPSPTPSPGPSPPADVPNGGGLPPSSGDPLSAAMMVLVGGSIAAAGVVTGALSWLRLRTSPVVGRAPRLASREAAAPGLALVGLLAVAAVLLVLRHRPQ